MSRPGCLSPPYRPLIAAQSQRGFQLAAKSRIAHFLQDAGSASLSASEFFLRPSLQSKIRPLQLAQCC
jgi:hypothetical protein